MKNFAFYFAIQLIYSTLNIYNYKDEIFQINYLLIYNEKNMFSIYLLI